MMERPTPSVFLFPCKQKKKNNAEQQKLGKDHLFMSFYGSRFQNTTYPEFNFSYFPTFSQQQIDHTRIIS